MPTDTKAANPVLIALAAMVSLAVIMGIGRFVFTSLLPMMLRDHLVDLRQGGGLATANYIGYFVGAMMCTVIRRYSRHAVRQCLAAVVVLTALMGWFDGQVVWVILRFVTGVVTGFGFVSTSGWCLGWLAATNRMHLGGIMYMGPGVGIFVSGLVGSAMFDHGWRSQPAWVWCGALALVSSLLIWRIAGRAAPSAARPGHAAKTVQAGHTAARNVPLAQDRGPGSRAATPAVPRYLVVGHILAYGMEGFGYIITATFLPVMAHHALANASGQALLWPLFGLCIAVGALLSTRVPVAWNHCKLLATAYLLQCLGVLCTVFWLSITGFALGSILLGLPFTAITLFGMREAGRLGGAKGVQLMAAMTACYALGQIVGPPLATHLVSYTGGFGASLGVAAVILFLGAALYMTLFVLERRFIRSCRG